MSQDRYVNVRSGVVVGVFARGPVQFSIATVTDDGYGPRRTAPAKAFHDDYPADGESYATGYVPVQPPGGRSRSSVTENRMDLLDNLDQLDNAALARLVDEQQRTASEAADLAKRAKDTLKARRKNEGLEVYGNVTLAFAPDKKFSAALAVANLTPAELHQISIPKPDAAMARAVFKHTPDRLKLCLEDNGLKLTVREVTGKDLAEMAMATAHAPQDVKEAFDLDELAH